MECTGIAPKDGMQSESDGEAIGRAGRSGSRGSGRRQRARRASPPPPMQQEKGEGLQQEPAHSQITQEERGAGPDSQSSLDTTTSNDSWGAGAAAALGLPSGPAGEGLGARALAAPHLPNVWQPYTADTAARLVAEARAAVRQRAPPAAPLPPMGTQQGDSAAPLPRALQQQQQQQQQQRWQGGTGGAAAEVGRLEQDPGRSFWVGWTEEEAELRVGRVERSELQRQLWEADAGWRHRQRLPARAPGARLPGTEEQREALARALASQHLRSLAVAAGRDIRQVRSGAAAGACAALPCSRRRRWDALTAVAAPAPAPCPQLGAGAPQALVEAMLHHLSLRNSAPGARANAAAAAFATITVGEVGGGGAPAPAPAPVPRPAAPRGSGCHTGCGPVSSQH